MDLKVDCNECGRRGGLNITEITEGIFQGCVRGRCMACGGDRLYDVSRENGRTSLHPIIVGEPKNRNMESLEK